MSAPDLVATTAVHEGRTRLLSPTVGMWRAAVADGHGLRSGEPIGTLTVLERSHRVFAPEHVSGVVTRATTRGAAEYGTVLLEIETGVSASESKASSIEREGVHVVRSPSSGRVYVRPSPAEAPFVDPSAVVSVGQTLCLLEIMKTFHRVSYGGSTLPSRARVVAVLVADGVDVSAGEPLFELAALEGESG